MWACFVSGLVNLLFWLWSRILINDRSRTTLSVLDCLGSRHTHTHTHKRLCFKLCSSFIIIIILSLYENVLGSPKDVSDVSVLGRCLLWNESNRWTCFQMRSLLLCCLCAALVQLLCSYGYTLIGVSARVTILGKFHSEKGACLGLKPQLSCRVWVLSGFGLFFFSFFRHWYHLSGKKSTMLFNCLSFS